ncbi:AGE family epimerase/isomerase [Alteromonas oceanisediminis]|uniref:AGE family epimerase/isomerase n=1 Tax=Alteromonas oceanisediminis TaxID=2836180 RepID=UPI001BD91FA8|nr:AGE family epimerase/isomerase [Alteromonas oceanisediminis]MBT0586822.1 AGE family epimerase/isomerase [Alteromonas oceanisediminis]
MLTEPIVSDVGFSSSAVTQELRTIASWWKRHALDKHCGGFYGQVDNQALPVPDSFKGVVLNTRILWFFSELAAQSRDSVDEATAYRAYDWLKTFFHDREYGGLFWALDSQGVPLDDKKQVYAQCFGIYALCSYFKLTRETEALEMARSLFDMVETNARDQLNGGYIEACTRVWGNIEDYRLSDKDLNCPKSMNTHLHVLEAYTSLYTIAPDARVEEALEHVLEVFLDKIKGAGKCHLSLFFDIQWKSLSQSVSFGHDIEASWLLCEAADALGQEVIKQKVNTAAIELAQACYQKGLATAGYMLDEYEFHSGVFGQNSYWWVQAEALVGFVNAYQLTGQKHYLDVCLPIWKFLEDEHFDEGEWLWLARSQGGEQLHYKAGFWKGPYHNGRAMLELQKRLKRVGR